MRRIMKHLTPLAQAKEYTDEAMEAVAVPFLYRCTGAGDSAAIAEIVNDFFHHGTAMTMKLVITGRMGIVCSADRYAMRVDGENARGAVCHLDFSDCEIPEIMAADAFLYLGGTAKVCLTGLSVTAAGSCVILNGGGCTFDRCVIIGKEDWGVIVQSGASGAAAFLTCRIMGGRQGIYAAAANPNVTVKLTGCEISGGGSGYDVYQSSQGSTMSWYIEGCSFASSQIWVDGAEKTAGTATANTCCYMPAYANFFSRAIG